jgi:hypothetical protein
MASRKTDLFEVVPSTHRQPQIRTAAVTEPPPRKIDFKTRMIGGFG